MNYEAPKPGNGWRLFNPDGVTVAPSDLEYIDLSEGSETDHKWAESSCRDTSFKKIFPELFYRTRKGVKKPVNRLALKMSKAKTIREAREIYKKAVQK